MAPQTSIKASNSRVRRKQSRESIRTCPYCQRTFNKNEHALRHIRSHTKERPFECRYCGNSYPRSDTLRRHERSHLGKSARKGAGSQQHQSLGPTDADSNGESSSTLPLLGTVAVPQVSLQHDTSATQPYASQSMEHHGYAEVYPVPDHANLFLAQDFAHDRSKNHDSVHDLPSGAVPAIVANDQLPPAGEIDSEIGFPHHSDSTLTDDNWLLSSDFDIEAIDCALNDALFEWAHVLPINTDLPSTLEASTQQLNQEYGPAAQENSITTPTVTKWYAQLQPEEAAIINLISRAQSEDPQDGLRIDERYTATLSKHLLPRQYEETRLSVNYLNECLRLYFTRFHPIFPVVHFPSFRPNSKNALLFLSMCSIGSLFVGSPAALSQGYNIYSRLNKAILAAWETYLAETPQRSLYMVQAALIGQTFGLLSGKSNNVVMTDMYQGTMITWGRKLGCFKRVSPELPSEGLEPTDQARAWKRWIHAEQLQRMLLALHIHDAELSSLLHHEPLLRHLSLQYSSITHDALFDAPSASKWYTLVNQFRPQMAQTTSTRVGSWISNLFSPLENNISIGMMNSQFVSYTVLENISASIIESRQLGEFDVEQKQTLEHGLVQWFACFRRTVFFNKQDLFALRMLWHSCFLSLTTDFDSLEQALGRDGQSRLAEYVQEINDWATSSDAFRALTHAVALQTYVEGMRMNWTPAIHVPRILFNAGTAWLCHHCWHKSTETHTEQLYQQWKSFASHLPEIQVDGWIHDNQLAQVMSLLDVRATAHYQGTIYGIIELLQRLNRWTISNSFATILKEASSAIFRD